MSDLTTALRATSDALLRDLEVLETLEAEKRVLPLDDPRVLELSARIEEVAERILAGSAHQRSLAEDVGGAPIATQPRPVSAILAQWRDAERLRAEAEPGSPEALEAEVRIRRAQLEYRRSFEAARRRNDANDGSGGT